MPYPHMTLIEQRVDAPRVEDVTAAVERALEPFARFPGLRRGAEVAITAGSRRIAGMGEVLRATVRVIRDRGARPVIVPTMGSHGGGTAEGRVEILRGYGLTEDALEVPIRAEDGVEVLGRTEDGVTVYANRGALAADRIIAVNRVKRHTRFFGRIESGITKMMLVGLGDLEGAVACHRAAADLGFDRLAASAARLWQASGKVWCGLGLVENARGELSQVMAAAPGDFLDVDALLLRRAVALELRLPFRTLDLLIVDRIGKDISGTGMDVNVIGARPDSPVRIGCIFVRDLSPASKGNAHGIGLADVTTERLVRKMDPCVTEANARAARRPEAARVPPAFASDRGCLRFALEQVGGRPARVIWIRDTLHLARCYVSSALAREAERRPDLKVLSCPMPLRFDAAGDLRVPAGPGCDPPRRGSDRPGSPERV